MTNETDPAALTWFTSSKSSGNGQCTMCARLPDGGMAVKDSKDPDGPVLLFSAGQWRAFTQDIRLNDLN
jgi:Domain of unknown function (DUF397)